DDKETKQTARKMIELVNNINTRDFEGRQRVSCMSCHHGSSGRPERTPLLAVEMTPEEAARAGRGGPGRGGPGGAPGQAGPAGPGGQAGQGAAAGAPPAAAAPAQPPKPTETVDQVVDKYLQAIGGRAALDKATTRVMTGTVTMRNLQSAAFTVQEKASGEYRIDIQTQPNPTLRAFDGTAAWTTQGPQN